MDRSTQLGVTHVLRKQRIKNMVYGLLGAASYGPGLTWVRNAMHSGPSLRILMYHKVNALPGNTLSTAPGVFFKQMKSLKEHYTVISPDQLNRVMTDEGKLPNRAVLLTFDDGYLDVYENAYPILKEMGFKALIFPATDYIGTATPFPHDERLPMLNPALGWNHLQNMCDVFTVGSHTRSHQIMTTLPLHIAKEEIVASKARIEDQLGHEVQYFCYPKGGSGQFSQPLEDMVQAAGYRASFVTLTGPNTLKYVRGGKWLRRYHVESFHDFMFARLLDGSCDAIGIKDTRLGGFAKCIFNRMLGTAT